MTDHNKTQLQVDEASSNRNGTHLEERALPAPQHLNFLTPAELRSSFLIENLLVPDQPRFYRVHMDRMVVGGIVPSEPWTLPEFREFGSGSFHESRESGILNLGGTGSVEVDGEKYGLGQFDCLYIGKGSKHVVFHPAQPRAQQPVYYLLSCLAHRACPTTLSRAQDATVREVGSAETCSRRKIRQYIHEAGVQSSQLVLGFTEVPGGSAWNTMPPHLHTRRSEIYFYFDLHEHMVMHLMGEPQNTRHLIVHDRQAVLSPPWSIHCGAGTGPYRFVWGMAGENKSFDDMDPVGIAELR